MTDHEVAELLMINEPAFNVRGKQYSVCCPGGDTFCTWDSDGNMFDFKGVTDILDHWIIDGKPFREILKDIELD